MDEIARVLAPFRPALAHVAARCAAAGGQAWLIGGTLRDALAGRPIKDLDLAVSLSGLDLARAVADDLGGAFVPLDADHEVARIVLADGAVLDIAALRAPTIEADLAARDFTINALAAPLAADGTAGPLLDPLGGARDLAAGMVRLCGPAAFSADPLRMLRAARIAAAMGFQLDAGLDRALRAAAPRIAEVSSERVRDEFLALLATRRSASWLRYLERAGILLTIIPELAPSVGADQPGHFFDVWEHTLEAVCAGEWILAQLAGDDRPSPPAPPADRGDPYPPAFFDHPAAARIYRDLRVELQWGREALAHMEAPLPGGHTHAALWKLALLLHDIAKPATRSDKPDGGISFYGHQDVGADAARAIGERLRLSRAEIDYVCAVVRGHMRPGQLYEQGETTQRAAYRFFRDLGGAAVDTILHSLADHMSARGPKLSPPHWVIHQAWIDAMFGFHWDVAHEERRVPLVDGRALMAALGLRPGRLVGELLEAIREAQAAGEVRTADEALALARRLHP